MSSRSRTGGSKSEMTEKMERNKRIQKEANDQQTNQIPQSLIVGENGKLTKVDPSGRMTPWSWEN